MRDGLESITIAFVLLLAALCVAASSASGQSILIDRNARSDSNETRGAMPALLIGSCAVSTFPVGTINRGLGGSDRMTNRGGASTSADPMTTGGGEVLFYPGDHPEINSIWSRVVRGNHHRPIPYTREIVTKDRYLVVRVPFLKSALKRIEDPTGLYATAETVRRFSAAYPKLRKTCKVQQK